MDKQGALARLKTFDKELAYLAALTYEGLKPLSRWEKACPADVLDALHDLSLYSQTIMRWVLSGDEVIEIVFSRSPVMIRLYEATFARTRVDKSARTQHLEGYLFGFPPCCVRQYIKQPYSPNDLPQEDQQLLFHWACNHCEITRLLLPEYRWIYSFIENLKL